MPPPRPSVFTKSKNKRKPKAPTPCQICYAPMNPEGDDWRCDRHGLRSEIEQARNPTPIPPPTPPPPPKPPKVTRQPRAPRPAPAPRVRQRRTSAETATERRLRENETRRKAAALKAKTDEIVSRYRGGEKISSIAQDHARLGYKNPNSAVVSIYRILKLAGLR